MITSGGIRASKEIDETIAELKLKAMNITIDKLTAQQQKYLQTWEIGTT
jgi:adenosylhomocysteinase